MVRIAGVQFSGRANKDANIERASALIERAAADGARIVCLPELFNTMYFCLWEKREYFDFAEPIPGPTTERIASLARKLEIAIVCPIFERTDDGRYFNTASLIGPAGEELGRYRKMSIPYIKGPLKGKEKFYFQPGDLGFPVFETPFGVKAGILICYDRHFPEAARALGLAGADVVFVPTCTQDGFNTWETELRAHAISNMYYVCAVNKVGRDDGGSDRVHHGHSLIVNPRGGVLADAGDSVDAVISSDIDPELIAATRSAWGFYGNRRPDAYASVATQAAR
jgi:beta-ureidopropionase